MSVDRLTHIRHNWQEKGNGPRGRDVDFLLGLVGEGECDDREELRRLARRIITHDYSPLSTNTPAWNDAVALARTVQDCLPVESAVREALERLVADLETNSEAGAPDYAHKALALPATESAQPEYPGAEQQEWMDAPMGESAQPEHPCPKGDECALNKGAVHCFACGRNYPPDETWESAQPEVERHG